MGPAGKPDGVTIKTIVSQGEYATSVNEAQNLQAQLAEAKITLDLEVLESGAYVDRWVAADFDAAVALNGGRPDPDGMYGRYFTSTGNLNKVAGYSSPELDAALRRRARRPATPPARKPIYTQISDELEDNAVWIWMFTSYTYTATTPDVAGFVPMANGSLQYLRTTTVRSTLVDPRRARATGWSHVAVARRRRSPCSGSRHRVRHAPVDPGRPDHRRPRHRGRGAHARPAGGAASLLRPRPAVGTVQFFSWLGNVLTGNLGYSARAQAERRSR